MIRQNSGAGSSSSSNQDTASFLDHLHGLFRSVDTDNNGYVNANEIKRILESVYRCQFSDDTVNLMVRIFVDRQLTASTRRRQQPAYINMMTERKGLMLGGFVMLQQCVKNWHQSFIQADSDHSGAIDIEEYRQILHIYGFRLSDDFTRLFFEMFDVGSKRRLKFDEYVKLMMSLMATTKEFRSLDNMLVGKVQMDFDTFLRTMISIKSLLDG